MKARSKFGVTAFVLAAGAASAWLGLAAETPARGRTATSEYASRAIWACDQRKLVIVEGVPAGAKLPPEKARKVASLLQDLMRFCNEEITARLDVNESITIEANGRVQHDYVPGGELTIVNASFGEPTDREQKIWKAELDKLVAEGNRLFHSDEIGANGLACAMCHPNAANTHPETYPKFQTQLKKVALLRDMVNWCLENPLEGKPMAGDDPRLRALEAYILSQRAGKPLTPGKH
jgi:thiosulfate dehydrogenase